jgi:protoheme IX farnesyltransferase
MAEKSVIMNFTAKRIKSEISLMKLSISLMSSLTALAGYSMRLPVLSEGACGTAAGVFLLAAGSSVLNNFQDRFADRSMVRTSERPLPSGAVLPFNAFIRAVVFISAGIIILTVNSRSILPAAAGIIAVILYNGIYTKFKKHRFISFFSGVVCGMLPPLIGWFAAGGIAPTTQIIYFMILLGIWQIPHTWLIVMINRSDYKTAGINTIIDIFSEEILNLMLFLWIQFFAVSILFTGFFIVNKNALMLILLVCNAIFPVITFFTRLIKKNYDRIYVSLFHQLNFSMLGATLLTISYPAIAQVAF